MDQGATKTTQTRRGPGRAQRPQRPSRERRRDGGFGSSASELASKTIGVERVSRMVAGGRRFRFRAFVAVGNRSGVLGVGLGKGLDVRRAIEKATRRAQSSTIAVPIKNGTLPREILVKKGAAKILMRPAKPGHGIVAGGVIRTLCDLAGITDVSAKILSRSTNDLANARAVMEGFRVLSDRVAVASTRKGPTPKASPESTP